MDMLGLLSATPGHALDAGGSAYLLSFLSGSPTDSGTDPALQPGVLRKEPKRRDSGCGLGWAPGSSGTRKRGVSLAFALICRPW